MATTSTNHTIALNNKALAAIDKYLTNPTLVLAGKQCTPADIKAAMQAENAALADVDATRLRLRRALSDAQPAKKAGQSTRSALRAYLIVQFGPSAVDVLGEFGFAPKAKQARSAATAARAVEKAKATRLARHTMGKKQRLAIKAPAQPVAPVVPSDGQ